MMAAFPLKGGVGRQGSSAIPYARRNGRACASLTARGGGLPIGVRAVPRITLHGITLSPSAYRPFPTVAHAVARLEAGCRWRGGKSAGTMPTLNALREGRRE